MSFLRCWQLRKQKTSNNAQENYLENQLGDDTTPPYGPENLSFDQRRQPKTKKSNKSEGKLRSGAVSALIDPFRKSKKKCDNKSLDNVDGRANGGVGHQQRRTPLFTTKKVSWNTVDATACTSTDTDDQQQRKESKGSYDYIDAEECHDGAHSSAFCQIRDTRHIIATAHGPSSSRHHHQSQAADASPQSRYAYVDFGGKSDEPQQQQPLLCQQQRQQRVAVPPPSQRRAAAADEPLYATASSQIYSLGGSEDPYSSIVSIGGGGYAGGSTSATYDQHGYSRIVHKNGSNPTKLTGIQPSSSMMVQVAMCRNNRGNHFPELDELYAKIDRKTSAGQHPLAAHSSSASSGNQFHRQQSFPQPTAGQQHHQHSIVAAEFGGGGGESGSGSICSSTQPSYRYLTVREDATVVQERIRQREEQQQRANLQRHLEQQESGDAYYSTIGNEYETVGDGNVIVANGCGIGVPVQQLPNGEGPSSLSSFNSFRQPVPPQQQPPPNHLSLNVDFPDHAASASSPIPLPPTSPIPKLQPQQLLQHTNNNTNNNFQQHHQQQLSSSSFSSSPTTAKVPMPPPPPPPPPPYIRRPVVMPTANSPSNGALVTNGCVERTSAAPLLSNANISSPKKSATSALRLSFFNVSPLNFFNNSSSKVVEKPAPPVSSPTKAMMAAETNGLLNGTGKVGDCGTKKDTAHNQHHSRIPIFNRHKSVVAAVGGIHRTRTPSPTIAAAAVVSAASSTSLNCTTEVGTQTITAPPQSRLMTNNIHHQQQRHHQFGNKTGTTTTTALARDLPSSSRRTSPLPVQVGQDYVSTIELSKKGGGGDQRAWPLKAATNMAKTMMSASVSSSSYCLDNK